MSIENSNMPDTEAKKPQEEPAKRCGETNAQVEPACTARELPSARGRRHRLLRPIFVISGVAFCMGLGACVGSYDTFGSGYATTTTTSYRPGYRVTSLPGGYRSERISGNTYYYHGGHYYQPSSSGYVVVSAPRNSRYYEEYGRYQRSSQSNRRPDGYSNRRDNRGDQRYDQRYDRDGYTTRLPDGYRQVNYRGNTYYQAGDRYFRQQGDRYVVVARPY